METESKLLEMITTHVGAPRVNHAYVEKESDDMIAVGVDLASKYCELDAYGEDENGMPNFYIGVNEESIYLNNAVDRNEPTVIEFPTIIGYNVWSVNLSRYTLRICFIKK